MFRSLVFGLIAWALLGGAAQAGPWLRAESPHFIVYGDAGEKSLRDYTLMLEDYDALLRAFHGRKIDEPVSSKFSVYLVSNLDDFHVIFPDAQKGIVGMYWVSEEDIFAVATRGMGGERAQPGHGDNTVMHEYAHHFMAQYYANGYPPWFVEGYAEYFSTADLGKKLTIGATNPGRVYGLLNDPWIPINVLLTRATSELPDNALEPYYAESWLLTHYIMDNTARRTAMQNYVNGYRTGHEPVDAWTTAFGEPPQAFEKKLRDALKGPVMGTIIQRSWAAPTVTVTPLSPGAGKVLLAAQFLKRRAEAAPSSALMKTVQDAAAAFPDDRAVQIALARAKIVSGDDAGGQAVLREMLKKTPNDAEALRTLAGSIMDAADKAAPAARRAAYESAKPLLVEAVKDDPGGYQTQYRFAQSQFAGPEYLSDETVHALFKAIDLAPQVPRPRINAAKIAIDRRSPDVARNLLLPVANDPHERELSKIAREMIASLPPAAAQPPAP